MNKKVKLIKAKIKKIQITPEVLDNNENILSAASMLLTLNVINIKCY